MFEIKAGAQVGIVTGSASDKPLVEKVTAVLDEFGVVWEWNILSAHRTPNKVAKYTQEAEARGLKVLIGIAGLAAALPGCLAAHTLLPVIGVPGDSGPLSGVDALHSIVQMPPGIPVATVGIGNGKNAGYLAVHILSLFMPELRERLRAYRRSLGDIEE
ncbi:MAG: 5-(carboxyamino)imidazole ribonucleotide mutase [Fibrobacter sp.]|jgi:5-(carboxyamino)imidazole ribonucleotide mutase|nr:5-(carboxyamino)imidazole ribonucleotide mutase [Fibrobacter sp.]